jgi:acetylornithine/N-succinyldiaminopimelate aminotransferase
MSETEALQKRFSAVLMPNYGVPPVAISRGQGCRVWDADGREYLDLIAGIAVSSLGHAHPAIVEAVTSQVAALAHTSNLFLHEREVELAERLLSLLGVDGRVFFTNSGTEANEAAVKLVRRTQGPARPVMVAAEHSFHGRTMGALALTGKESIRAPFGPFGLTVRFVPFGDAAALSEAVDADCAAVFLEPCLGEGGVVPAPPGYLRAAREACDRAGALLVLDEIQSGIGRTGTWFAHQSEEVRPDILTLAKGLGGGLPIGACIGLEPAAPSGPSTPPTSSTPSEPFSSSTPSVSFTPPAPPGPAFAKGEHGSTFGGNPVACAAALAVLDTIERDGLLGNVAAVGERLVAGIGAIDHPLVAGIRGSGLWLAIALTSDRAAGVEAAARQAGFLVNAVPPNAIRVAPPLILSADQAAEFTAALPGILDAAERA